jgi:hypothetical protein
MSEYASTYSWYDYFANKFPSTNHINTPLDTSDSDGKNDDNPKQYKIQTYPTMLKLISGSLVGGANYNDIYIELDDEDVLNSP